MSRPTASTSAPPAASATTTTRRSSRASDVVNAIPAVVDAAPGVLTALDLPLITGPGLAWSDPADRAATAGNLRCHERASVESVHGHHRRRHRRGHPHRSWQGQRDGPGPWNELPAVFAELDRDDAVRVVVLSGSGKNFSYGLDLPGMAGDLAPALAPDSRAAAHPFPRRSCVCSRV